jgi:hypothetical protein
VTNAVGRLVHAPRTARGPGVATAAATVTTTGVVAVATVDPTTAAATGVANGAVTDDASRAGR